MRTPGAGKAHPDPVWPHLLLWPYFRIRPHSHVPDRCEFWWDIVQPSTLGHRVNVCVVLWEMTRPFPKWCHFSLPWITQSSYCLTSSLAVSIVSTEVDMWWSHEGLICFLMIHDVAQFLHAFLLIHMYHVSYFLKYLFRPFFQLYCIFLSCSVLSLLILDISPLSSVHFASISLSLKLFCSFP